MSSEMTLKEIAVLALELESRLLDSGGEINEEIENLLALKEANLPAKVDGYFYAIERMESIANEYKERSEAFYRVSRSMTNLKEGLRDRIKKFMLDHNEHHLLGFETQFKINKGQGKLVVDEAALPEEYKIIVTTKEPDKEKIKGDLKMGLEVQGAHYEPNFQLRSSIKKGNK